jgi:hypothetical protein
MTAPCLLRVLCVCCACVNDDNDNDNDRRRLEYGPHSISWGDVEAEALTGKTFVSPFPDREGRPVVIMRPR